QVPQLRNQRRFQLHPVHRSACRRQVLRHLAVSCANFNPTEILLFRPVQRMPPYPDLASDLLGPSPPPKVLSQSLSGHEAGIVAAFARSRRIPASTKPPSLAASPPLR